MKAAPLLVSFNSLDKYLDALPENVRKEHFDDLKFLVSRSYPPVISPICLSVLFGYSLNFVYALSKKQYKFYRTFVIRKGKKSRVINSPKVALKAIQKWFGYHLGCATEFPSHVFGFVQGRSFIGAAEHHIGASWVFSVDIDDFFGSISRADVSNALKGIGYTDKAADLMADLCCFGGVLAQGSPASPVLSNLFMKKIDQDILALAEKYKVVVTRYADDIVFSGCNEFDLNLRVELDNLFQETSLRINKNKIYFADSKKGQRLKVHGLLVKKEKISLTKGYRNKLRAYRHMVKTGKVCSDDLARMNAHIKFGEFVDKTESA